MSSVRKSLPIRWGVTCRYITKNKKMISIRIFYIKRLFLKQKIILDIFFKKKSENHFLVSEIDFFYIKKLFSDIRKYLINIDFFHIKKHTPKNQLYFLI